MDQLKSQVSKLQVQVNKLVEQVNAWPQYRKIGAAIIIIYLFSFYISVVKGISIRRRFLEMALISLGIAALAFGIGLLARLILHIEVI